MVTVTVTRVCESFIAFHTCFVIFKFPFEVATLVSGVKVNTFAWPST